MISAKLAVRNEAAYGLHRALCAVGGRMLSSTSIPTKLQVGTFRPAQLFPWAKVSVDDFLTAAAKRRIRRQEEMADESAASIEPSAAPVQPDLYELASPRCKAVRDTRRSWLYRHGKHCTLRCMPLHLFCTQAELLLRQALDSMLSPQSRWLSAAVGW